jgi:dolichyl-phosphate-mannose-protein mannosyltransferase
MILMSVVTGASLVARVAYLDQPYDARLHQSNLIFDEQYYVNAARLLDGIRPPQGSTYATAQLFHDPNAEHPPLAKLIIAFTIKLLGDNPWGWRLGPIVFGTVAVLLMYWMVHSAHGGGWLALGAAALMAADNLMFVHGRIATLDIFYVTFMLAAVALYLRRWLVLAGVAIGVGMTTKLIAADTAILLVLLELALFVRREGGRGLILNRDALARAKSLGLTIGVSLATYVVVLYVLDLVAAPIGGPGSCATDPSGFRNPILHTVFMLCYAGKLTAPSGPTGIASYPWEWLLNMNAIDYYTLAVNTVNNGRIVATHPIVEFRGEMNPAIIFLALPAMGLAVRRWWRDRDLLSAVCLAWFVGTFGPFVVAAAPLGSLGNRISYIYYMIAVLPAISVGVAQLFSRRWMPAAALVGYIAIVVYWFVTLYPMRVPSLA